MHIDKSLSYRDYAKIRSIDPKEIDSKDLARFLVLSSFAASKEIAMLRDMQKTLIRDWNFLIKKYRKWKPVFRFLDAIFLEIYARVARKEQRNILFQNSKYSSLISETKENMHVGLLVQGKKDRLFAIENLMGYVGINDLEPHIIDYLNTKDEKYLQRLLRAAEKKIKKAGPDYIVFRSDAPPIERAIILVAKKLGITTLEIQHGMYNPFFQPVFNGLAADYILVWGKYFKDLYTKLGIRAPEDIFVLGYPYPMKTHSPEKNRPNKKGDYTVCWLGEDLERYNKDFFPIKIETVKKLAEICKELGLKFIYRPHPYEDRRTLQKNIPGIGLTHKKERLEETFSSAEIFISFVSTALIESTMRSKVSLQLMNYPTRVESFENLGVCSKSFLSLGALERYLSEITEAQNLDEFKVKFNNDYIDIRNDPAQRFLEIIGEIEKQKNAR